MIKVLADRMVDNEKYKASEGITKYINRRKSSSQQNGNEPAVFKSDQFDYIEVLGNFDRDRKKQYVHRQGDDIFGEKHSEKAANKHSNKHIAYIRANKIILYK